MNDKYQKISWGEIDEACEAMARWVKKYHPELTSIFGIPRGGLVIAVIMSHKLNLPIINEPIETKTLVVDDIADTGETLYHYRFNIIATIHYHRDSKVVPDFWFDFKDKKWILYPWETAETTD